MKLVGGDSGRVEHEELVESVVLAPSERAVVDVLVERPGELALEHHTPDRSYQLATIVVSEEPAVPSPAAQEFEQLRRAPELAAERRQLDRWLAAPADKVLAPGRWSMPARCIPRSPATSPGAAPSAA
jgi:hypothetical protein